MVYLGDDFLFSSLEDAGEEALLQFVLGELRSGSMSAAHQRQLAAFFEPNGREKFRLNFTRKRGKRKNEDRFSEFEAKIQPFRRFRAKVRQEFKAEIERDGEDRVVLRQAELAKKDGGFGVSRPTAKRLLDFLKIDEETCWEANKERLEQEATLRNQQVGPKPK